MSFSLEAHSGPDSVNGMHSGNGMYEDFFLAEFDELFDEEEFKALGINPAEPTQAKPGSEDKVTMLAARYAAGLPLWHAEDCNDHGPEDTDYEDILDLDD